MKIRTKLLVSFILVALIAGAIGLFSIRNLNKLKNADAELYNNVAVSLAQCSDISTYYQRIRINIRDAYMSDSRQELDKYLAIADDLDKKLEETIDKLKASSLDETDKANGEALAKARVEYSLFFPKLKQLLYDDNHAGVLSLIRKDWATANKNLQKAVDTVLQYNLDMGKKLSEQNNSLATASALSMVIMIVIGIVIAVSLGLLIASNIQNIIKSVIGQTKKLTDAALAGNFTTRANEAETNEEFRDIVVGINKTLDVIVDKTVWYESIIDAVPFPIHVTDENMMWTYMNKPFEKLMIEQGVVKDRTSGYGMACSNAGANICNTPNCGIKQLLKGNNQSFFDWCGMSCKQDTAYLKNIKGENTGFVEVVTDLTSIIRVSDYTKAEVERIESNLKHLSNGSLEFNLNIKEGDEHTKAVKEQFERINTSLIMVKDAVGELVKDTSLLSKAAIEGKLSTRAEASKHQGDFRKVVEGVNETLDSVIGPLNVAAQYVDMIAKGDMPELITKEYNGDFNNIKNNLNSLITSFSEIITKAKMVSQGDLTITLAKRSENDELMAALSNMVSRLGEIVGQVMEAAQNVAISSNEMSKSAIQISEGANEQSASAEEVSSSIEEMSSAIQQNSDNSLTTEKIAVSSAQGMMEVNTSSQKSLEAMRQISDKIKIINDIAGKTDILAINAAIEAARAGEQGKGFAVVAAEVRKLAEVSQKAAVEINELSASSLRITEESVSLLMKIIPEIEKTAQLVKEIAASSNEQRSGSEQISKAILQFSQVTQQNAASSEEMSSSSEELASQAELLKETISFFNTGKQIKSAPKPIQKPVKARPVTSNLYHHTMEPKAGVRVNLEGSDKDDNMFENY
ncbi:MAG TPA: methyl-accepting chemotaxis protein [Bacteroidales bacterium]|nr:methyl-accepting chemotaxis protein [Bacteroidales bacterium]